MHPTSAKPRWPLAAMALAIAVGTLLRWWALGGQSLWFDEGYSAFVAALPDARAVIRVVASDTSLPLYYLLLHAWTGLAGMSEAALRAPSALAATAALLLFARLAWILLPDRRIAVAALAAFALHAVPIEFAKEARGYSLLAMFHLAAILCVATARESRRPVAWLVAAGVVSGLATWIHNVAILHCAALTLAAILLTGGPARRRIGRGAAVALPAVAVFAVWLPMWLTQVQSMAQRGFWPAHPGIGELASAVAHLSLGVNWWTGNGLGDLAGYGPPWEGVAVCLSMSAVALALLLGVRDRVTRALSIATAGLGLIPILALFATSQGRTSVFVPYAASASTGPLVLLLALGAAAALRLPRLPRCGTLAAMAVAVLLIAQSTHAWSRHRVKEPWRAAVAFVRATPPEGRLVVFVSNESEVLYRYYAAGRFDAPDPAPGPGTLPATLGMPADFFAASTPQTMARVSDATPMDALESALRHPALRRVVLIESHASFADPAARVRRLLTATLGPDAAELRGDFSQIQVYQWVRP